MKTPVEGRHDDVISDVIIDRFYMFVLKGVFDPFRVEIGKSWH